MVVCFGAGPIEDVLIVDEEIPAIGAIAGAHERPVCLIEIQMTALVGRLHRVERNCIRSIWEDRRGRLEVWSTKAFPVSDNRREVWT